MLFIVLPIPVCHTIIFDGAVVMLQFSRSLFPINTVIGPRCICDSSDIFGKLLCILFKVAICDKGYRIPIATPFVIAAVAFYFAQKVSEQAVFLVIVCVPSVSSGSATAPSASNSSKRSILSRMSKMSVIRCSPVVSDSCYHFAHCGKELYLSSLIRSYLNATLILPSNLSCNAKALCSQY
jgi:hypothetical protein